MDEREHGPASRVLQIHPTRRCNLRCLHCYSSSSPEARDALPVETVLAVLDDAWAEGYRIAGFSGGEPLLWKGLEASAAHARALGFTTTVVTNGMLLDRAPLDRLARSVHLLAISLDGVPSSHDRMRGAPGAFSRMEGNLARLRDSGIAFGFVFPLTQRNLPELEWVVEFAVERGAALVQVHPLEAVGRGTALSADVPDETESSYAYLEALRLAESHAERIRIHVDLFDPRALREDPERVFAGRPPTDGDLAALVSPLVVEPDGTVVPVRFGVERSLALGNVLETRLSGLAASWKAGGLAAFRERCRRVFEATVPAEGDALLFNWYESFARG